MRAKSEVPRPRYSYARKCANSRLWQAAARVFRLVAKFAALISIFILVLIVRCWFPLPIERLCGSMELSFAFVVGRNTLCASEADWAVE